MLIGCPISQHHFHYHKYFHVYFSKNQISFSKVFEKDVLLKVLVLLGKMEFFLENGFSFWTNNPKWFSLESTLKCGIFRMIGKIAFLKRFYFILWVTFILRCKISAIFAHNILTSSKLVITRITIRRKANIRQILDGQSNALLI